MLPSRERLWISAIFLVVTLGAVLPAPPDLLDSPFRVVQDDGRHFVAWLRRLGDSGLFPGDPIADYFGQLTPQVYRALFLPAAFLGVDVQIWHLLVLTPLSVGAFLWAADRFLRLVVPAAHQRIPMLAVLALVTSYDVPLGLPRSFREAIVLGALVLFLHRRRIWLLVLMAAGANMYPSAAAVVGLALLGLVLLRLARTRQIDWNEVGTLVLAGVGAVAGLALFVLGAGETGSTLTRPEIESMPIFGPAGRARFFTGPFWEIALCNGRGGLLPFCLGGPGPVPLLLTLGVLVWGLLALRRLGPDGDALALRAREALWVLVAAGIFLWIAAWLVLFEAHLPSRYAWVSLGLASCIALAAGLAWLTSRAAPGRRPLALGLLTAAVLVAAAVLRPAGRQLLLDPEPELSAWLRTTPPDTLVGGFPLYVDSVPAFAARSAWASPELTVPYKADYLALMESRAATLLRLVAGPTDAAWRRALEDSGLDILVISLDPESAAQREALGRWESAFPEIDARISGWDLPTDVVRASPEAAQACTVASGETLALLDLACFALRTAGRELGPTPPAPG